jgi:hypothetical protein
MDNTKNPPTAVGVEPYIVTFTRDGEKLPTAHLTVRAWTIENARRLARDLCPVTHKAAVYAVTLTRLDDEREDHNERTALLLRNGRWGTCSGCPRDALGHAFPEECKFTNRYDHNLGPEQT